MKLLYDQETDSLYIDLNARPSVDSREIQDGIVLDFDAAGKSMVLIFSTPRRFSTGDPRDRVPSGGTPEAGLNTVASNNERGNQEPDRRGRQSYVGILRKK